MEDTVCLGWPSIHVMFKCKAMVTDQIVSGFQLEIEISLPPTHPSMFPGQKLFSCYHGLSLNSVPIHPTSFTKKQIHQQLQDVHSTWHGMYLAVKTVCLWSQADVLLYP